MDATVPPFDEGQEAPALDVSALERLAGLDPQGRAALLPRVLHTYQASLRRLVTQVSSAAQAGDLPAAQLAAHTLKSSSASVGALRLSGLCAEIENRVRAQRSDGLVELARSLQAESLKVDSAVQAMLEQDARRLNP